MIWPINKNEQWTLAKNHPKSYNVAGAYPRDHPKIRWLDNINNNLKPLKIIVELAFNWHKWRKETQKKTYSPNMSNARK